MAQLTTAPLIAPLLLATDGSPSAHVAQQLLLSLAQILSRDPETEDLIHILTVKPQLLPNAGRKPVEDDYEVLVEPNLKSNTAEEQQLLQAIAAKIPSSLPIWLEARRGRPISEILNYARLIQAGLIAVGHQGLATGLRDFLLGSVSSAIARYAACPVLIARPQAERLGAPLWQHLLLVVDGSQATQGAIAMTHQLLAIGIQQVTILGVQPPLTAQYLFGPFATPTPNWQLMQSLQQAQKEQSEQIVQQAEAVLSPSQVRVQTLTFMSEPGPCICQVAQQQGIDVIIMGSDSRKPKYSSGGNAATDSRRGLNQIRLSATADFVIHHAPCSVLLCRASRTSTDVASTQSVPGKIT